MSSFKKKKFRPRSVYCMNIKDDCHKLKKNVKLISLKESNQIFDDKSSHSSTNLVCYGCARSGVIRSKCSNGQSHSTSSDTIQLKALEFDETALPLDTPNKNRHISTGPLLPLTIAIANGVKYADSGAQVTFAGHNLYQILVKNNCECSMSRVPLSYVDVVPIILNILRHFEINHTWLGVDFLGKAMIVLNSPEDYWFL